MYVCVFLTGDLLSGLVGRDVCVCVFLTGDLLTGLEAEMFVCVSDRRPAFGSCRQRCLCVCVCF